MIHLFKKVYLSLDVFGVFNNTSSERLYITGTDFPMPITADRRLRAECKILGVHTSLEEIDKELGGRDKVWEMLHATDKAIVVIVDNTTANELCLQYWKSSLPDADEQTLFTLHQLMMNHENLLAIADSSISEKTGIRASSVSKRIVPVLSQEEFTALNTTVGASEYLKGVSREDLSIEFAVASYLNDSQSARNKQVLFDKMDYIVKKTYLETFVEMAMTLQRRFASLNRSEYDHLNLSLCPFENMKQIPALQWTFKRSIITRDMEAVAKDFSIRKTIDIYKEIDELNIFVSPEKNKELVRVGEMLLAKDYTKIMDEEAGDQKRSSLFAGTSFREKVNSLLISYLCRLKRQGKTDELKKFIVR